MDRNYQYYVLILLSIGLVCEIQAEEVFLPDDQIISDPRVSLVDPEVDHRNNRIAWQSLTGELWVADLDPDTADLSPRNGMGTLVDTNLAPLIFTLNGPEWAYSSSSSWIVYTKSESNRFSIASARQDQSGGWIAGSLKKSLFRYAPIGTPSSNTRPAKVSYYVYHKQSGDRYLAWRNLTNPASEGVYADTTAISARWVENLPLLVTTAIRDGFKQVITYDAENAIASQLTFDPTDKHLPYIWFAPEYGELLMMTMVDKMSIGVYQQQGGVWTRVYLLSLPTTKPFVHSPEPFVYQGKSYILLVAADQLGAGGSFSGIPVGPTEIWIAGIDPNQPFFRRIDDPRYEANRLDPEIYITTSDAVALYTEKNEVTRRFLLKRAITGLGAGP